MTTGNANAVTTDAIAVTTLIAPESQYVACQIVHTSMKCVAPHATMKAPNERINQWNGRSRRAR